MDTKTLMNVVAMIDARIDKLNKGKEAINASGYSVLSKRLSLERMTGATDILEELSNYLQIKIDADIAAMENSTGE